MTLPICRVCSRNARTVDTPRVKVRVEACTVVKHHDGMYTLFARCHGARTQTDLGTDNVELWTEDDIATLEIF